MLGEGAWRAGGVCLAPAPHSGVTRRRLPPPVQLDGWVAEKKLLMAGEAPRGPDDALQQPPPARAPKRWLRHRAFMAELAQNKEWLRKIEKVPGGGGRAGEGARPRQHPGELLGAEESERGALCLCVCVRAGGGLLARRPGGERGGREAARGPWLWDLGVFLPVPRGWWRCCVSCQSPGGPLPRASPPPPPPACAGTACAWHMCGSAHFSAALSLPLPLLGGTDWVTEECSCLTLAAPEEPQRPPPQLSSGQGLQRSCSRGTPAVL